ncbi:hypothetical protein [Streptomyces sioyaensis]
MADGGRPPTLDKVIYLDEPSLVRAGARFERGHLVERPKALAA